MVGKLSYEYPAWACSSDPVVLKGKKMEVAGCRMKSSYVCRTVPFWARLMENRCPHKRIGTGQVVVVQGQERPAVAAGRNLPVPSRNTDGRGHSEAHTLRDPTDEPRELMA